MESKEKGLVWAIDRAVKSTEKHIQVIMSRVKKQCKG